MYDLGIIKPGSTIYIPFGSYAVATGAPSATTGLATSDILVYKDGGTTQRASAAGFSVAADFDSLTGINLVTIDLADNTTAGFWAAGSRYVVVVGDITIDGQTYRFPSATFTIGVAGATLNTTIASLSSQTSFTLTVGPAEDDALNGCAVYIHDVASAVQGGYAFVSDYTGSTKTVTLAAGTTFTAAATDNISVFPPTNVHAWRGTAVVAPDTAGYPKVTLKTGTGTGEVDLSSGRVKPLDRYIQNVAVDNFPFAMILTADKTYATGKTVAVSYSHDDGTSFTSLGNATEKANGGYQIDLTNTAMNAQQVMLRMTNADCDDKLIVITTVP